MINRGQTLPSGRHSQAAQDSNFTVQSTQSKTHISIPSYSITLLTLNHNSQPHKMSQPIAVIIGATGGQGGSVVDSFLKDGKYQVRAVTRNVNSANAQALHKRGVEVVTADLNDQASLIQAFKVIDQTPS
jgi:hypothetical protein